MQDHLLKNLKRGARLEGVFLVESANFKQTRNGKHFVQLTLRDHSAAVKALRWDSNREEFRGIERNPFLRVSGRVEEYQGNMQIVVDNLEPVAADDARVDPAEFLPRSPFDISQMQKELDGIIASIPDESVRRLVLQILGRPGLRESFRNAPAGKSMHHAYVGGLLEHVLSLAQLAERVCDHYRWLDRSMLIAGVVVHDIAKTSELSYSTGFGYTDEGQLIGHIVLACTWIRDAARELGDIDEEISLQLEHLVAAHHGRLEYGSPKKPMTAEALAMHFIDNLDAKLAGFWQAFQEARPGPGDSRFGDQNFMLEVRPFFPRRMDGLSEDLLPPHFDGGSPAKPSGGGKSRPSTPPADEAGDSSKDETGSLPF